MYYTGFLILLVWFVTTEIIQMYNETIQTKVDLLYVKKKNIYRFFSIIFFSIAFYLILNPKINGTTISLHYIWVIWVLCFFNGVKFIYDLIGPVLSKKFVSELNSNYYAVYLRSFSIEKNHAFNSVEERLCNILKKKIPIFAIGNPNEVVSKIGAERLYASDDNWEDMVVKLMDDSRVILVRPSDTVGCLVELNHIVKRHLIEKSLFLVSSGEEVNVLYTHLQLKEIKELASLANHFPKGTILGLKIGTDGRYSSFIFDSSNRSLTFFLNMYRIEMGKNCSHVRLSIGQQIADRLAFVLNPLFYASVFEWGIMQKVLVSLLMAWPLILCMLKVAGLSLGLAFFITCSTLFLFSYYIIKSPRISQSNFQFASATHYMTRVRFLYIFNAIFLISFILALLNNQVFSASFISAMSLVAKFIPELLRFLTTIIKLFYLPLLIIASITLLYKLWNRYKK